VDEGRSDGHPGPVVAVCPNCESSCPELVVPANTLWYGTYRVNATVSVSISCHLSINVKVAC